MPDPFACETPLAATFTIRIDGHPLVLRNVGETLHFITDSRCVEWMEFYGLRKAAIGALEAAADNAMMSRQATNAVRALFSRAGLI